MSPIAIWSFFAKLETDVSLFSLSVCLYLCMVVWLTVDRNWAYIHFQFRFWLRP